MSSIPSTPISTNPSVSSTSLEIQNILSNNKLTDLKRFLNFRRCLNSTNLCLIYLFHLIQSSGILVTSFATGTHNTNLLWIGIALNLLASIIIIYEKTNSSLLKKLIADIKLIKEGNYVDECELIDAENDALVVNSNVNINANVSSNTNSISVKPLHSSQSV